MIQWLLVRVKKMSDIDNKKSEKNLMISDHEGISLESQDDTIDNELGTDLSIRARSKAITRERIIQSARHLFTLNGFHKATLRDIAEHAGLSTGAVFANFKDKQEIFNLILFEEMALIKKALKDGFNPEHSFKEKALHQFRIGCAYGLKSYGIFQSAFELFMTSQIESQPVVDQLNKTILATITNLYKRGLSTAEIKDIDDMEALILMVHDLTLSSIRRVFLVHKDIELETKLLSRYIDLIFERIEKNR
jgi:AcrR family transcriptional regulator